MMNENDVQVITDMMLQLTWLGFVVGMLVGWMLKDMADEFGPVWSRFLRRLLFRRRVK